MQVVLGAEPSSPLPMPRTIHCSEVMHPPACQPSVAIPGKAFCAIGHYLGSYSVFLAFSAGCTLK